MSRSVRATEEIIIPVGPLRRLVAIFLTVAIILALVWIAASQRDRIAVALGGTPATYIDSRLYQSVVLTTNQVYFGKLRIDGDVYLLTDVYSLNASNDTSSNSVQIVKRGDELNGPQEPLVIPGRAVLFFENMRADSQVMQAIGKIKLGQTSTPVPATPRPATPAPSPTR